MVTSRQLAYVVSLLGIYGCRMNWIVCVFGYVGTMAAALGRLFEIDADYIIFRGQDNLKLGVGLY